MAADEIFYKIKVDGQDINKAVESMGDLQEVIEALQSELETAKFGSDRFKELTKSLEDARSKAKNLEKQVEGFDNTQLIGSFAKLGEAIGGAFALTSIINFGDKADEVAKAQAKAQQTLAAIMGARAIAEGVVEGRIAANLILEKLRNNAITQYIMGTRTATAATEASTVATEASSTSMKVLRGAIVSTGIGALVILLGVLIANWDKVKAAISGNSETFNKFKKVLLFIAPPIGALLLLGDKIKEKFGGIPQFFAGVLNSVKGVFESLGDAFGELIQGHFKKAFQDVANIGVKATEDFAIGVKNNQNEINKEAAADALKIEIEKQKKLLGVQQAAGKETYALQRQILSNELSLLDKTSKEYADKQQEIAVLDVQHKKELLDKQKEANDKAKTAQKEHNDYLLEVEKQRIANIQDAKQRETEQTEFDYKQEIAATKKKNSDLKLSDEESKAALAVEEEKYRQKKVAINDKYTKIEQDNQKKAEDDFKTQQEKEYNDSLNNLSSFYNQRKLALLQSLESGKITSEQYNSQLQALELEKLKNLKVVYQDYGKDVTDISIQIAEKQIEIDNKATDNAKKNLEERRKAAKATFDSIQSIVGDVANMIQQLQQDEMDGADTVLQQQLNNIEKQRDAELTNKELTEDQKAAINEKYSDKENQLKSDSEEKKKQIQKKYADSQFAVQVAQIIGSTAQAIMTAFAQLGPVAGAIAAIPLGVTGAIQLDIAEKQREKVQALRYGGIVKGNSHAYGGVKYNMASGGVTELEGGEAVINRNSMEVGAIRKMASTLNELGGGVAFDSTPVKATGTVNTNSNLNIDNIADAVIKRIRVEVMEQDITNAQDKNSKLRSRAKVA